MNLRLKQEKIWGLGRLRLVVLSVGVFVLFLAGYSAAADDKADSGLPRYTVVSLRHISAQKGKDYLAQTRIGTVSQLPRANMLLITGSPRELIKASAILKVVDAEEPFVIKEILLVSSARDLPSIEQIGAKFGDLSIGTFSDPPTRIGQAKAIVDIHNGALVAVAPAGRLQEIVSAVNSLLPNRGPKPADVTNSERKPPNSEHKVSASEKQRANDEFFNKLLGSLVEAERRAAGQVQEVPRPNEPGVVVTIPEVEVPTEPGPVVTEPFRQPELAAVLKRLQELEAKLEVKPEPEAPKVVRVEIEQPTEVTVPVTKVWYQPESLPDADANLSLNLPPSLTIVEFLDYVGLMLNLDYLYDPKKMIGTVNLKLHGKLAGVIKKKELYPLCESVMQFHNFVMARKGNLVIVVPKAEADRIDAPFVRSEKEGLEYGDVIITRVFKLKHIDTATVNALLTNMQLGLKIRQVPETGTLIVTGYAYRMARIEELLGVVDKPGPPKKFEFRQLEYTQAKALAPKVKTLAEQLGTITVTVAAAPAAPAPRGRPPRGRPPARPRAPAPAAAKPAKPSVYLDADERTNRIMMIGLEDQLKIVNKLIDTLDVEQQDLRSLHSYYIKYVDAMEVRDKLAELGIIGAAQATPRRPASRPPAKGRPPAAAPAVRREEALVEEPQVVIIEATNSLLVNATPEQHAQIQLIIGYVDSETAVTTIPYMVYPLENQDPVELADVLMQLVRETVTGKDAKGAKIEKTTKRLEEDIYIIPDAKTYSLIVYASKKNQQWISSLIRQLDQYRPQVLLDVTLVEITKDDEFSYDLDMISELSMGREMQILGQTGFLTNFPRSHVLEAATTGAGLGKLHQDAGAKGFFGREHIQALFKLMAYKGYGRVLARPKLLVNDNEEGTITTEEHTSVPRLKTDVVAGPAGATPTTATSVSFESYKAGITLTITPHISKGDQLQLKIILNRTDFRLKDDYEIDGGASSGPTPPDLLTSNVDTVVTVPDDKTIILGGLEKVNQTKGGGKVPLIGDIPLIGGLFRSGSTASTQSKLYVFVKAHILRPGEKIEGLSDIEVVSARNRATFEKYEKEMQEYELWPGIKPKPLDPLRILD
ncbi:MAG: secretin N-terminal domain-containing protein [Planctomycetota bacterium]|jgi:type II secretory pathway component GspD/PulD (secretin)